jgi:hypothetical protein
LVVARGVYRRWQLLHALCGGSCAVRMPFIDAVIEGMQMLGNAALDTSSPFDEATVFGEVQGLRVRVDSRV